MLFFLDESGHDHGEAPYEVLAGVAIREQDLWNLIQAVRALELECFGVHMSEVGLELKGKKLLKRKTFRHAGQASVFAAEKRRDLARSFLKKGWLEANGSPVQPRSSEEFAGYGQAALSFVTSVLGAMARFRAKTFAVMVSKQALISADRAMLRRDYSFLFERFYYYLEDISSSEMGLIVFDELEKAQCRILLSQLERYFIDTAKGYQRSGRIVPEPFFVHSDLTTAVQLADLVAYCLNWAGRLKKMDEPVREEIKPFVDQIFAMRYTGERADEFGERVWPVYGFTYLDDLRPRHERNADN